MGTAGFGSVSSVSTEQLNAFFLTLGVMARAGGMTVCPFQEMEVSGEYHIKQNKPGLERQISDVFSSRN